MAFKLDIQGQPENPEQGQEAKTGGAVDGLDCREVTYMARVLASGSLKDFFHSSRLWRPFIIEPS